MGFHAEHAHLVARDSLSHVHLDADTVAKSKAKAAAAKKAAAKKSSLSHVDLAAAKKKNKAASKHSLSHVSTEDYKKVDNKDAFIHKAAKDRTASADVVTVDSVVYVTATRGSSTSSTSVAATSATSAADAAASYASAKSAAHKKHNWHSTKTGSTTSSVATSSAITSTAATAVVVGSGVTTSRTSSTHAATVSVGSVSNAKSSSAHDMSSGSKAGLAIGILLAIALAVGLVFFCIRRRKNANRDDKEESMNEKHGSFFGSNQQAPASYRSSIASVSSARTASTAPRLSLRPVTQFLPNILTTTTSPFDDDATNNEKQSNPFDDGDNPDAKIGTAAAVTVPATARGPNNVHRVQLDFKPSMDDELELKSGQLVRMLHEYDDGWALCIRMDRSQQGVCPRTCLSKLAVKPRPQGPPQNGRPAPARGPSPPNADSMVPRPLTPNSQNRERAQTMGKTSPASSDSSARLRSQSVSDGAVVPSRKPVPGQAL